MDPPAANGAAFMPESSRVQFIVDWRPFGMAFTAAEERREGRRRLSLAFWRGRKHKVNRVVNVSLPFRPLSARKWWQIGIYTAKRRGSRLPLQIKRCSALLGTNMADSLLRCCSAAAAKTLLHVIPSPKGARVARAVLIDGCKGTAMPAFPFTFPSPIDSSLVGRSRHSVDPH